MQCLYCHKRLGLFASKKRQFCSQLHETWYEDEANGSLIRRLLEPLVDDLPPEAVPVAAGAEPLEIPAVAAPVVAPPPLVTPPPLPALEPPPLQQYLAQKPALVPPPPLVAAEVRKELEIPLATVLLRESDLQAMDSLTIPLEEELEATSNLEVELPRSAQEAAQAQDDAQEEVDARVLQALFPLHPRARALLQEFPSPAPLAATFAVQMPQRADGLLRVPDSTEFDTFDTTADTVESVAGAVEAGIYRDPASLLPLYGAVPMPGVGSPRDTKRLELALDLPVAPAALVLESHLDFIPRIHSLLMQGMETVSLPALSIIPPPSAPRFELPLEPASFATTQPGFGWTSYLHSIPLQGRLDEAAAATLTKPSVRSPSPLVDPTAPLETSIAVRYPGAPFTNAVQPPVTTFVPLRTQAPPAAMPPLPSEIAAQDFSVVPSGPELVVRPVTSRRRDMAFSEASRGTVAPTAVRGIPIMALPAEIVAQDYPVVPSGSELVVRPVTGRSREIAFSNASRETLAPSAVRGIPILTLPAEIAAQDYPVAPLGSALAVPPVTGRARDMAISDASRGTVAPAAVRGIPILALPAEIVAQDYPVAPLGSALAVPPVTGRARDMAVSDESRWTLAPAAVRAIPIMALPAEAVAAPVRIPTRHWPVEDPSMPLQPARPLDFRPRRTVARIPRPEAYHEITPAPGLVKAGGRLRIPTLTTATSVGWIPRALEEDRVWQTASPERFRAASLIQFVTAPAHRAPGHIVPCAGMLTWNPAAEEAQAILSGLLQKPQTRRAADAALGRGLGHFLQSRLTSLGQPVAG